MQEAASSDAFDGPGEPYPGLRPFLDHEAVLLQGRSSQVREIIHRLEQTQFVAVVGGSGSGKSSLVRAGVVPKLRGFGIAEAGDYWVPVIFTPGTTRNEPSDASTNSPLTRLAWKLSRVLAPAADLAADEARRAEIEQVFRQGAGFSRLVDAYAADLPDQGADRGRACFLFVIDQFEELFHPHNRGREEVRLLVEAVISHFFNPHKRCHVVLTMRSEHLADCAAYLNLPDAINRSLYLVRRLSRQELRDAIVGPAQYLLRLRQRADAGRRRGLPRELRFDEALIERLLADVESIAYDPDHLPLLQHVLARTWEAACRRSGIAPNAGVPAEMTWADLERAVLPARAANAASGSATGPAPSLAARPELNCLRASLNNQAQAEYERRAPEARELVDRVLRELAYRDPNNGLYFQQRLELHRLNLPGGVPVSAEQLRGLLEHGFLDSVNYLFWDRENPQRPTLKVSHEAFIRGWDHFRKLIDIEAERFDEFVAVLRKCRDHVDRPAGPRSLLADSDLLRMESNQLAPVFEDAALRREWFKVLPQYRDGARLAGLETSVEAYVRESRELHQRARDAERAREQRQIETERQLAVTRAGRRKARALVVMGLSLLAIAVFLVLVQHPVIESVRGYALARIQIERYQSPDGGTDDRHLPMPARELGVLLKAAEQVRKAQEKSRFLYGWALNTLRDLPPVSTVREVYEVSTSEPLLNGTLRKVLTTWPWRTRTDFEKLTAAQRFEPRALRDASCQVEQRAGQQVRVRRGTVFIDGNRTLQGRALRAVFVPEDSPASTEISLHHAIVDDAGTRCLFAGVDFWSVPRRLKPAILLDARVRFLAVITDSVDSSGPQANGAPAGPAEAVAGGGPGAGPQRAVTLYNIRYLMDGNDEFVGARLEPRAVLIERVAQEVFAREFRERRGATASTEEVRSVTSWREPGGYGFRAGGQSWRLLDDSGEPIVEPGPESDWLKLSAGGSRELSQACRQLKEDIEGRAQPGFSSEFHELAPRHCLEIKRGEPAGVDGRMGPHVAASARQQVLVGLYEKPSASLRGMLGGNLPSSVASFTAFERRRVARPGEDEEWLVGVGGRHAGWIAIRRRQGDGSWAYSGAPMTTAALVALGGEVHSLALEAARAPAQAPPPTGPAPQASSTRP